MKKALKLFWSGFKVAAFIVLFIYVLILHKKLNMHIKYVDSEILDMFQAEENKNDPSKWTPNLYGVWPNQQPIQSIKDTKSTGPTISAKFPYKECPYCHDILEYDLQNNKFADHDFINFNLSKTEVYQTCIKNFVSVLQRNTSGKIFKIVPTPQGTPVPPVEYKVPKLRDLFKSYFIKKASA